MTETEHQVVIAGGGLAGLSCAIHLRLLGLQVTLIEKSVYPHHKVCGEYVSNEIIPHLSFLGIDPFAAGAVRINRLIFSPPKGRPVNAELALGGFGLSRYVLDNLLFERAVSLGCTVVRDSVVFMQFKDNRFEIETRSSGKLITRLAIGAYGKRSALDQKLSRSFAFKKSPWLAVKGHFEGDFPDDLVGLHNFKGGYCGVSRIENGKINICYLCDYESFKKYGDISDFQAEVLCRNPNLASIFNTCTPIFEQPLSISQVSFAKKQPVEQHVLMIGDTAGLIHPLCGNGMAMAVHSAKICAELSSAFLKGGISRTELEKGYRSAWNRNFKKRLFTGRVLSSLIRKEWLFKPLSGLLVKFPGILPFIIKQTHGQPI